MSVHFNTPEPVLTDRERRLRVKLGDLHDALEQAAREVELIRRDYREAIEDPRWPWLLGEFDAINARWDEICQQKRPTTQDDDSDAAL